MSNHQKHHMEELQETVNQLGETSHRDEAQAHRLTVRAFALLCLLLESPGAQETAEPDILPGDDPEQ